MAQSTTTTEEQLELLNEFQNHVLSNLDFSELHAGSFVRYVEQSALAKNSIDFAFESFVHRAVQLGLHLREHFVDGAAYVAAKGGLSYGDARAILNRQSELAALPALRADFRNGSLSAQQVEVVLEAWRIDPKCVGELGRLACELTVDELRERVKKIKAAQKPKPESELKKNSRLGFRDAEDPFMQLMFGLFTNEEAAEIKAKLEPETNRVFRKTSKAGTFISRQHCRAQALLNLLRHSGGREARAHILFVFDFAAYQRGEKTLDAICDIPGIGPVAKERLLKQLETAFIDVDLEGLDPGNDHSSHESSQARFATEAIRRRKDRHGHVCSMRGCNMRVGLDMDHNEECRDGGVTCECNLDWLCRRHHQMKTLNRFILIGPRGSKSFARMKAGP